ncbi:hypothetical protein [Arthrobacter woluwensis]|uniref:hypothetical protein n=1 Tax=Arthrobacter woluwensis TaxID=156980 RepID=UPI00381E7DF0
MSDINHQPVETPLQQVLKAEADRRQKYLLTAYALVGIGAAVVLLALLLRVPQLIPVSVVALGAAIVAGSHVVPDKTVRTFGWITGIVLALGAVGIWNILSPLM